ncbi:MAG TPA: response regulator, partial [Phototrophicaceae bacterium]|nr:response regulator [Phototrophicaceae bacterium]
NKLDIIFEKFTQADNSTTRKFGGTGLGLSICRQLAQLMRGEVAAESVYGQGSTFSFTVTLERDQEEEKPESPCLVSSSILRGKKTLIVDDVKPSITILSEQLASMGIISAATNTSSAALEILAEAQRKGTPFDLLITDYILPEMESDAFTQQVKDIYPDMPVIMVTALAERGYMQIFASSGCDACLTKPVKTSQLLDILNRLFEAKHAGRGLSMLTPEAISGKRKSSVSVAQEDNGFLESAEILLVEDNKANRDLGIKLLENFACHPTTARNGEEAIDILRKRSFDLILMDCQMPEMDGFEASSLLREMKERGEIADIPIIALTANAMKGDKEKCLESGMNDYLIKPLRKTALRNILMEWLPPKEKRLIKNNDSWAV